MTPIFGASSVTRIGSTRSAEHTTRAAARTPTCCGAGDNFYDRKGDATAAFYDQLTLQAKSKIMLTVPGNHDYCAPSHLRVHRLCGTLGTHTEVGC
jgi:hypothetical protein